MTENREAANSLFDRLTSWIVDLPWLTVLLLTLITSVSLVGYYAPHLVIDLFRATEEVELVDNSKQKKETKPKKSPKVETLSL